MSTEEALHVYVTNTIDHRDLGRELKSVLFLLVAKMMIGETLVDPWNA